MTDENGSTDELKNLSEQVKSTKLTSDNNGTTVKNPSDAGSTTTAEASNEASNAQEKEENEEKASADASLLKKLLRSRLEEDNSAIEIERKNPESPLYSVKNFEDLNLKPELLQGLYAMGFTKPSKIQETALPALLGDPPQNLIAQSQSGTGKTAAFSLAMLSRIDTSKNYPQALCLAPTMELAAQITDVVRNMGQFMKNLKIASAIRGNLVPKNTELSEQVIIGTPGTAFDWSCPKVNVFSLKKLKVFILDEADVMIDQQGHQDICIRIVKGLPSTCQLMLFSATYKTPVIDFATKIVKDPMIIRLRRSEESLSYIKQFYVKCENFESKYRALTNIFGLLTVGQSIIFCHTRRTARDLVIRLTSDGVPCELLSGELDVIQRASVIKRFREGKCKMLVTTNVTARGIDVDDVNLVINFDLPICQDGSPDYETYLHRIGRTGRFGKFGVAVNFVESGSMGVMERIQKHFGRPIEKLDATDPEQIEKINK